PTENLPSNQAVSRRTSTRSARVRPIRPESGYASSRYSQITPESGMTSPLSSTRVGTVPAGFISRYSGRRSQTFSSRNSNGRRFSASTSRTLRENGDKGRWWSTRISGVYRTPRGGAQRRTAGVDQFSGHLSGQLPGHLSGQLPGHLPGQPHGQPRGRARRQSSGQPSRQRPETERPLHRLNSARLGLRQGWTPPPARLEPAQITRHNQVHRRRHDAEILQPGRPLGHDIVPLQHQQ